MIPHYKVWKQVNLCFNRIWRAFKNRFYLYLKLFNMYTHFEVRCIYSSPCEHVDFVDGERLSRINAYWIDIGSHALDECCIVTDILGVRHEVGGCSEAERVEKRANHRGIIRRIRSWETVVCEAVNSYIFIEVDASKTLLDLNTILCNIIVYV